MKYNSKKIEKKWQRLWEKVKIYQTPDKIKRKKNFYCLDMFPYPSGEGLHVGHLRGYVGSDVVARYFRMAGFNVLHPMGFDAFGLPAENAAIKRRIHPRVWTYKNIKNIRKQLKSVGASYDWSREVITCDPNYYKWTQWLFLELYKAGLVYRAEMPANWCPSCKTILANEQVIDGKCQRCGSQVFQRKIEQWLFGITKYADDLLKDLKDLKWPETTKIMQRNWIGKSEGWEITFEIKDSRLKIQVFTTRIDTLFGATYLVVAPEHSIIQNLKSEILNLKSVEQYIEESKKKTERERISEVKEKTGVEIRGIKAVNPVNNREIPIFVADYVLSHYATGAIMAVPAHDSRDWDFSKTYNLPIIEVIKPPDSTTGFPDYAYEGEGTLVNSDRFDGLKSAEARQRMGEWLAKTGKAEKTTHFKLRDWLISRQRYWGVPIPMVYCQNCGWQPVKEKNLPILLPRVKNYLPAGEGKSPLAKSKNFIEAGCPKCKRPARRETDTMDTFVCSAWYYFRYADPKNGKKFAAKKKINLWLPVDIYVGGAGGEHSIGHLLYSRFLTKVLKKLQHLNFPEPFLKLRHPGIILGPDRQRMSKSKGNVITPEETGRKYGMDTLRLYEMFMGPFDETMPWDVRGIEGCYRFLQKVWKLSKNVKRKAQGENPQLKAQNGEMERLLHKTIKKVTEDIENFRFNTAISALMILVNKMTAAPWLPIINYQLLLRILAPFAPHLTEELWQRLPNIDKPITEFSVRNSIHNQTWPKYNSKLTEEGVITLIVQINGKVRDKMEAEADISEKKAKELTLSREKVRKWIGGRKIKKIIFVPNKLINIVI